MKPQYTRESEKRLIKAVSKIVEEEGFLKVGINRISRIAGCDKVLIYRYFGGLNGLINAWAKENDFYVMAYETFIEEVNIFDKGDIRNLVKKVLLAQLHFLRENRMMQELLIWELTGRSKFKALQDIREENGYRLQQILSNIVGSENKDINLYITVLVTAIDFVVICTRQYPVFNGVDFNREESWDRFEKVIINYIDMLFDTIDL
ncbi:MAG: TetR/AcrR family transcriptional regulator [Dysgonomonas sp.]|nr:TetR/AcrR family transcriptional regulator [Dysgonomonas sp.]